MNASQAVNQKLRNQIRPIMEMLKHKKPELKEIAWISLVRKTEQSIIKSPSEYTIGISHKEILNEIVHKMFDQFLDESIR